MTKEEKEFLTHVENAHKVISERYPNSREASLAKTKLEEAVMWLAKAPRFERAEEKP